MTTILREICESKRPLKLKAMLPLSNCPCGNAAVLPHGDETKYLCAFREFNYCFYNNVSYVHEHDEYTTYGMWVGILDNDFAPFRANIDGLRVNYMGFQDTCGFKLEDPKLTRWDDEICISMTKTPDHSVFDNTFVVGCLKDEDWKITIDLTYDSRYGYSCGSREKNWMPCVQKNKMVHSVQDKITRIVDIKTNEVVDAPNEVPVPSNLRGNTNLLQLDNGDAISVMHVRLGDGQYVHYFVGFNKDGAVNHVSEQFTFDNLFGVEFASSMFFKNQSNHQQICITVCEDDYFQYVYTFNADRLMDFIYNGKMVNSP